MENYLNTLVRYRRSVQQQDAESWYDDSSEEYVPDTQTFDYPDVDYSGKITCHFLFVKYISFAGSAYVDTRCRFGAQE